MARLLACPRVMCSRCLTDSTLAKLELPFQGAPLSFKRVLRAMCCRCIAEWDLHILHETSRKVVVW